MFVHMSRLPSATLTACLKDRGHLVLVDRDDNLRIFHADTTLYRAGNAAGDIEWWGNHLACLVNLPVVARLAGIDGRAGPAQLVGHRLEDLVELRN